MVFRIGSLKQDLRGTLDHIKCHLSRYLTLNNALDVSGRGQDRNEPEKSAKEARQDVSCSVGFSLTNGVVHIPVDKDPTHPKRIRIASINAEEQKGNSHNNLEISLHPSCPRPLQILDIIVDLSSLRAKRNDHFDGRKCLISVAG